MVFTTDYDNIMRKELSKSFVGWYKIQSGVQRRFYLGIGGKPTGSKYNSNTVTQWKLGTVPTEHSTDKIENLIAMKLIDSRGFVNAISEMQYQPENPRHIITNDGRYWEMTGSSDINTFNVSDDAITTNIYMSFRLHLKDLPTSDIYQLGLFIDTVPKPSHLNQSLLLPNEVQSLGNMMTFENLKVIQRDSLVREVFDFVIEF